MSIKGKSSNQSVAGSSLQTPRGTNSSRVSSKQKTESEKD